MTRLDTEHASSVAQSQRRTPGGASISLGTCCPLPAPAPALHLEGSGFFPHGAGDLGQDGITDVPFPSDMC